jgi:bifunctional DNase/RNase
MIIEMKVYGLMLDPFNHVPIVILRDMDGRNTIPIWIGIQEALAIDMKLHPEKNPMTRPMTHDLMKNILAALNIELVKIVITDLQENTFFAELHLDQGGETIVIDARPSDSIALALRTNSPIWVDEKVIAKSQKIEISDEKSGEEQAIPQKNWEDILKGLTPDDFGKYKM